MFQNISNDYDDQNIEEEYEDVKLNSKNRIIKRIFSVQNIIIYILSFMMSMVGFGNGLAPFGLAIFATSCSTNIPIGIVYILTLIGTFIGFGGNILLAYFLTTLVFILSIILFKPKIQNEYKNEKRKLGLHLFFSTLIVQFCVEIFGGLIVYDVLFSIALSISTVVFYKIFSNSLIVLKEYGKKQAFTIEEVIGASLIITIAISCFRNFNIFGFSVTNIISILIVLILGWKNGVLVGATTGITIGVVLGIIGVGEPIMIASYALSGMIGGIFNRFGKIGVIIGFILGNAGLAFASNGATISIIRLQEILIASLGLLLVPNNININIEDLIGQTKLLPTTNKKILETKENTIYKLNSVSDAISEMANTYAEVAATTIEEKTIQQAEDYEYNKDLFINELISNMEENTSNILYEDITDAQGDIISDIFSYLVKKGRIETQDLINIFEVYNNYIIGADNEKSSVMLDINQVVKIINDTYKICKLNSLWQKKLEENRKNISSQLDGVSKVISSIAEEISKENNIKDGQFSKEREEIKSILKQKNIELQDLLIEQHKNGRYIINIYIDTCKQDNHKECVIEKIEAVLSKILKEEIVNQNFLCGLKENKKICKLTFISKDKYSMQIGMARQTKAKSIISGDSTLQVRLEDGKYLIAISDGMGSGPNARKSSKIAIKMLERLLTSGFDKDVSLELINSAINLNSEEETYATLDIAILDLYQGNIEFIKNGACPTFIKNKENVDIIKTISLPAGILENIDLVVYDRDLVEEDILVMCSDGILDSVQDNKETWLKQLISRIQVVDNVQKVADIILSEAIDNNYGMPKDDMTVIVIKVK